MEVKTMELLGILAGNSAASASSCEGIDCDSGCNCDCFDSGSCNEPD
jgi:hypothetical protein